MFRTEIHFYKHEALNQSYTTPVLISLFTATCFGTDYDPSSGLIYVDTEKITYCIRKEIFFYVENIF